MSLHEAERVALPALLAHDARKPIAEPRPIDIVEKHGNRPCAPKSDVIEASLDISARLAGHRTSVPEQSIRVCNEGLSPPPRPTPRNAACPSHGRGRRACAAATSASPRAAGARPTALRSRAARVGA